MAVNGSESPELHQNENEVDNSFDSEEEDVEPKLTYERMSNDVSSILKEDSASCIAVHSKLIALGTHYGKIHILDHQGNVVQGRKWSLHLTTVNMISIDEKGEYFATCSDDRVVIHGFYTSDNNHLVMFDRPVRAVAIDPYFARQGSNRKFITGDDKITLYERSLFNRYKTTCLQQGRGQIRNIKWNGELIAWASDLCIKIYDLSVRAVITVIEREKDLDPRLRLELYKCCFCWKDDRTLLVGWADSIKICCIKQRSLNDVSVKDLPRRYVEITSTFTIDSCVCGISPMNDCLVALCINKNTNMVLDTSTAHPQLQVIQPIGTDGCLEISNDILSPKNYTEYKSNDYHFECLTEEGFYFVVCPKDVIVAKPREIDDHVTWLLEHNEYQEALDVVKSNKGLKKHNLLDVGCKYLNYLLEQNHHSQIELAAKLMPTIFGVNKSAWEEEMMRFAEIQQLRVVSPYLPRGPDLTLDQSIYEMVLHEFLRFDSKGFLQTIREWSCKLYNIQTIVNAILHHLTSDPKNEDLLEALAELYSRDGRHEKALTIYLEIGNKKQVFDLIRHYNLFSTLQEKLELLMQLNPEEASRLLLENQEKIPTDLVVKKLKTKPRLLWTYLDRLIVKDPDSCKPQHGLLVELYAQFAPTKLINFLRSSNHYSLENALSICRRRNLIPEAIFLLGRMGNTKEALQYITDSLNDINYAIEFCKEHNDLELWEDLVKYSLAKPCFIRVLLQNIGTHMTDPISLIRRIPEGLEIDGLMFALVKILQDYNLQISLEEGCRKVLDSDCYSLLDKLCKQQSSGLSIADDCLCHGCHRKVFAREIRFASDIVIFNCRHVFHEDCLPNTGDFTQSVCFICVNQKKSEFRFT